MKLKAKDIKVGMRLAHGGMAVTESRPSLGAWLIHTDSLRVLNPDDELEVTAVLGKHVGRGVRLEGYGEVTGRDSISNPNFVGLVFASGEFYNVGRDSLVTLAPVPPKREALLDPKKHLQWAIDNKDWAQARAALTELEKN